MSDSPAKTRACFVLRAASVLTAFFLNTGTSDGQTLELYGSVQADAIVDFRRNDPTWYDVNRPTKLPPTPDAFGSNHHFYLSPRQSRLGVTGNVPTNRGDVKATLEFDMFGVGDEAGETTFQLLYAWGQWKQIGGGQTTSAFMDMDVFPDILDYWGPNGMVFFRNVQLFWEPFAGDTEVKIALEAPGGSGDKGRFEDRIELQNIIGRFPVPDLTGHVRFTRERGYLQIGGALRRIDYDDTLHDQFDLSGHVVGWGVSVSSNLDIRDDIVRLQAVYGDAVENYFDDAPADVGIKTNFADPIRPVLGEALPALGLVAFLEHPWSERWTTTAGYSRVHITNSDGQAAAAFKTGQYALANLLYTPVKTAMMGGEFQWARRDNFADGFAFNDFRFQFSFRYSFSTSIESP
jgi:DcaP outer membrane protein